MARGGAGADSGDAVHQSAGQRLDGDHRPHNLLLRSGALPAAQPALLQLSGPPPPI